MQKCPAIDVTATHSAPADASLSVDGYRLRPELLCRCVLDYQEGWAHQRGRWLDPATPVCSRIQRSDCDSNSLLPRALFRQLVRLALANVVAVMNSSATVSQESPRNQGGEDDQKRLPLLTGQRRNCQALQPRKGSAVEGRGAPIQQAQV